MERNCIQWTKTVTVSGLAGQVQSRIVYDIASEIATVWERKQGSNHSLDHFWSA
jgi:hypothetical protein